MTHDKLIIVSDIVMIASFLALGVAQVYVAVISHRLKKFQQKLAAEGHDMRKNGPPKEMVQKFARDAQAQIILQMGDSIDLVERTLTDLQFLHQLNPEDNHKDGCPVCKSTIPDLENFLATLKSAQILSVQDGEEQ